MKNRIARRERVEEITGFSRSHIYLLMAEGKFPKAIKIGARAVGWVESEIDAWLEGRIAASRAAK